MDYCTRVLTKHEDWPEFEELAQLIQDGHPYCRLTIESGDEEGWESLLLAGEDEAEIAVIERLPVFSGSVGEDEMADLLEDAREAGPESALAWLEEYLDEVRTVYAFRTLYGASTEEGSAAIHALRHFIWERGEAILQADHEGFTNEEGHHILWQFAETVSGPWSMAVLEEDSWASFTMDLGDPDQREHFMNGEVPPDVTHLQRRG